MKEKKITKSKLLSRTFSGKLAIWLNDALITLRRREELPKLKVYVDPKGEDCYTDGFYIVIGLRFPYFKLELLRGPETTFTAILGVLFHELGHVMYNHFIAAGISTQVIKEGTLWPYEPPSMSEKLKAYLAKGQICRSRVCEYYHILDNCLSDARVEHLMLTRHANYRRFAKGLELIRNVQFESADSLPVWFENEDKLSEAEKADKLQQALFSSIIQLGKFGKIKGLYDLKDHTELIDDIVNIDEYVADCIASSSAEEYYTALNIIFCEVFDEYILPFLETLPPPEKCEEALEKIKESLKKALGEAMASAADKTVSEGDKKAETEYSKARESISSHAPHKKTEGEDAESDKSGKGDASTKDYGEESGSTTADDSSETEDTESTVNGKDHEEAEDGAPSGATIINATSALWSDGEGSVTYVDGEEREAIACTLEAISRTEEGDSGEKRIIEAIKVPEDLDFGSANAGVDFIIEREPEAYPDDSTYGSYDAVVQIGKGTARRLKKFLQPVQKSMYERDRYSGTRIVQSKLANPNLRHFAKRNSNPSPPTLSVAILIDESGSMRGNRINSARSAAIALFEMCRALKVRYAVFGHTTQGRSVLMHNYCHFADNRESDKYKLLSISAGGENRDGAALRYVADQLHKEDSDRKLLIIVSDGMPSAPGYGGQSAIADIRNVIKDYEHYEGFNIVAAIIGEPKDTIRAIYGNERSIDIANLNDLPEELIRVVRKVI